LFYTDLIIQLLSATSKMLPMHLIMDKHKLPHFPLSSKNRRSDQIRRQNFLSKKHWNTEAFKHLNTEAQKAKNAA